MSPPPHIRDASPEDAAAIQAIYAPIVRDTPISFELDPPSVGEMAERMERVAATHPYLVAERDGAVIGYAYAGPFKERRAYRFAAEVTVYVAESAQGGGIGRALYGALLERLTESGHHTAIGIIALPNPGSVALHERVGFRHVGTVHEAGWKFDRWHDVGYWQRVLE